MCNVVIGGLQEHQTPRTDGICPSLTAAMGMGGGQISLLFEEIEDSNIKVCQEDKIENNKVQSVIGN